MFKTRSFGGFASPFLAWRKELLVGLAKPICPVGGRCLAFCETGLAITQGKPCSTLLTLSHVGLRVQNIWCRVYGLISYFHWLNPSTMGVSQSVVSFDVFIFSHL